MKFITSAGGLLYHYIALKYRNSLWIPYRNQLHKYLMAWPVKSKKILLIGPSGGYSLKPDFLQGFEQIDVREPDPLAEIIFKKRLPHRSLHWSLKDEFSIKKGTLQPHHFKNFLIKYPSHAILFCNFLGQLPLLAPHFFHDPKNRIQWTQVLSESLAHREWASYHDLYSTSAPLPDLPFSQWEKDQIDILDFLKPVFAAAQMNSIQLTDHWTQSLFPKEFPRKYTLWKRTPKTSHIIEMVYHRL